MKTKLVILILLSVLISSCVPILVDGAKGRVVSKEYHPAYTSVDNIVIVNNGRTRLQPVYRNHPERFHVSIRTILEGENEERVITISTYESFYKTLNVGDLVEYNKKSDEWRKIQ